MSDVTVHLENLKRKDPYTYYHQQRVAENSKLIAVHYAVRYGLSEEEVDIITTAAQYHDVGKIVIEKDLLNNYLVLNEEQREGAKRKHVIVGETILKTWFENPDIPRIVRHHHENYDGTGYPDGLREVEIPLGSRMIALADFYDAKLTRPYTANGSVGKEAGETKAREILLQQKSKQFDPGLVDILIELMNAGKWQSIK